MNQRKVLAILMAFTACALLMGVFTDNNHNQLQAQESLANDTIPSPYTFAGAFESAERFTGDAKWVGANQLQRNLIVSVLPLKDQLPHLPTGMLESLADRDVRKINDFLKRKKLDIQLRDQNDNSAFYFASVLSVNSKWAGGKQQTDDFTVGSKKYPAVNMENVRIYAPPSGHTHPIVEMLVEMKGIRVFATKYAGKTGGFAPLLAARKLTPAESDKRADYTHAIVPMIDLNTSGDVRWILGMSNTAGDQILQAKQQTILQLNEYGFRATTGFAAGAAKSATLYEPYTLDSTFVFWIVSTNTKVTYPVFTVVVSPNNWKNPGTIDTGERKGPGLLIP